MIKNKLIYLFSFCLLLALFVLPAEAKEELKGKILLQVESHGEAWYVLPDNSERVYLGRPYQAFMIMRDYGLGISSQDLDKYLEDGFPVRLLGKIVLAVEKHGEAYYINPDNLQGYYLGRPNDAFSIMRSLGLGISNSDLLNIIIREGVSMPDLNGNELSGGNNNYIKAVELTDAITLLPYNSDLNSFLSEFQDVYQLVKYLNNYFSFLDDDSLVSQNYEVFYENREGSMVDFVSFLNFALKSQGYQSGVLRYQNNLAVVFRDNYSPKYIVFSEDGVLIFEHGRSFKDVIINEEKRLNISIDRYLYFEGNVLDYQQAIEPYNWVNL